MAESDDIQAQDTGETPDSEHEQSETPTPEEGDESTEPQGEVVDGVAFLTPDPAIAEAQQHAREVEARLRAVSSAYKQLQEEMQNARERMKRQAALEREIQRGELVAGLFEPLENLRRSIEAIDKDESVGAEAKEGLSHVSKQFMSAFTGLGLEETGVVGAAFDPNLHEAIGVMPVESEDQDETIVEVFSKGYRIGSRLLQPARVIIGRVQESAGEA